MILRPCQLPRSAHVVPLHTGHFIHLQIPRNEMGCTSLHSILSTTYLTPLSSHSFILCSLDFAPPPAVISPPSCSQSPHRSRPLSPPLLYPPTKVVDCWITLELGGGRPTDCKERDNWSFSLIGFPDKQHPG